MEHRCGHRRTAALTVVIRTRHGLVIHGLITDISSSGAMIQSMPPLRRNTLVSIQFNTDATVEERRRSTVVGEVIREQRTGFAVEWCQFSPEVVVAIIRQLGRAHAKAPLTTD